jgi:hypothetical protein
MGERGAKCLKGENCECVAYPQLMVLCPDYVVDEVPPSSHHAESVINWLTIPEADRKLCLDHLLSVMEDHPSVIARWKRQKAAGMAIGSDDIRFHFGAGMSVRNVLRKVMPDDKLPGVTYENGTLVKNFDDYYYGAIDALASEP